MKNYKRSICSTCRHAPYCSLTTDMSNISSCSEYVHHLDKDNEPLLVVSLEMSNDTHKNHELILN